MEHPILQYMFQSTPCNQARAGLVQIINLCTSASQQPIDSKTSLYHSGANVSIPTEGAITAIGVTVTEVPGRLQGVAKEHDNAHNP